MAEDEEAIAYRKRLLKKDKPTLAKLCSKKGVSQGGTKADMVDRLCEYADKNGYPSSNRKASSPKTNEDDNLVDDDEGAASATSAGGGSRKQSQARKSSKAGGGGGGGSGNSGGGGGGSYQLAGGIGNITNIMAAICSICQGILAITHTVNVLNLLNVCPSALNFTVLTNTEDECVGDALFWERWIGTTKIDDTSTRLNQEWNSVFTFLPDIFFDNWTPMIFFIIAIFQCLSSGKWEFVSGNMIKGMIFFILMALFGAFGYAGQMGIVIGFFHVIASFFCFICIFNQRYADPWPTLNY